MSFLIILNGTLYLFIVNVFGLRLSGDNLAYLTQHKAYFLFVIRGLQEQKKGSWSDRRMVHLNYILVRTWSNMLKSLAEGWWMVQMMVRPPAARFFSSEIHWKHDELSRPLDGGTERLDTVLYRY